MASPPPPKLIPCPHQAHGCMQRLAPSALQQHLAVCEATPRPCDDPLCDVWVPRKDMDAHALVCAFRPLDPRAPEHGMSKRFLPADLNATSTDLHAFLARAINAEVDTDHCGKGDIVGNGDTYTLPVNGPQLLVSNELGDNTLAAWAFFLGGNSSFEVGCVASWMIGNKSALHQGEGVGAHNDTVSGSDLTTVISVKRGTSVLLLVSTKTLCGHVFVSGKWAAALDLRPIIERGPGVRLALTLWRNTTCTFFDAKALITDVAHGQVALQTTTYVGRPEAAPARVGQLPRSDPCAAGEHVSGEMKTCRVCTTCFRCTGYGDSCAITPSGGLQRAGEECGCGPGLTGCPCCGRCQECAQDHVPVQADALGAWQRATRPKAPPSRRVPIYSGFQGDF